MWCCVGECAFGGVDARNARARKFYAQTLRDPSKNTIAEGPPVKSKPALGPPVKSQRPSKGPSNHDGGSGPYYLPLVGRFSHALHMHSVLPPQMRDVHVTMHVTCTFVVRTKLWVDRTDSEGFRRRPTDRAPSENYI